MRTTIAFMAVMLCAGVLRAETPEEVLTEAIAQAKVCRFDVDTTTLDSEHNVIAHLPRQSNGKSKILEALDKGDERYAWTMEKLQDHVKVVTGDGTLDIVTNLHDRADYNLVGFLTVFKLHELVFTMKEEQVEGIWVPRHIDMHIHYTNRHSKKRFWQWDETHALYSIDFNCSVAIPTQ